MSTEGLSGSFISSDPLKYKYHATVYTSKVPHVRSSCNELRLTYMCAYSNRRECQINASWDVGYARASEMVRTAIWTVCSDLVGGHLGLPYFIAQGRLDKAQRS